MSATHFVVWASGERTHIASRNAYRRGQASWRHDEKNTVPEELVDTLGWWDWQTPINGPFPAFDAERLQDMTRWLQTHGYSVRVLDAPPA